MTFLSKVCNYYIEAGGYPHLVDESDYRYPPKEWLTMTPQERITKIESLMNEVAAEMREIPGTAHLSLFMHPMEHQVWIQFKGAIIGESLPATVDDCEDHTSYKCTIGGVYCYAHAAKEVTADV